MPVVTAIKCRRELTRRRNIGVAIKHMTDLVWIFLLDARQRQLRESLCYMRIELCRNVGSRDADQWNQQESEEKSVHPARTVCLASTSGHPVNACPTRTFGCQPVPDGG